MKSVKYIMLYNDSSYSQNIRCGSDDIRQLINKYSMIRISA